MRISSSELSSCSLTFYNPIREIISCDQTDIRQTMAVEQQKPRLEKKSYLFVPFSSSSGRNSRIAAVPERKESIYRIIFLPEINCPFISPRRLKYLLPITAILLSRSLPYLKRSNWLIGLLYCPENMAASVRFAV